MLTAVYCGVPGSYAEEAAILYFGDGAQLITASSFQNAFDRLRDGEADRAVVPIENSSTGAIAAVYDLLGRYGFHIVGEQYVRVRHCLLAKKEAELSDIREVVSHEQGISQSLEFLGQHPEWLRRPVYNTAAAAKMAAESEGLRLAAIASRRAAECYGLPYKGAVAPAYDADLVVVDDLQNFNAKLVVKAGKVVAKEGKPLFTCKKYIPDAVKNTVKIKPVSADDFKIALKGARANVMRIVKGGVVTEKVVREVKSTNGDVRLKGTDLLKLAIVERHHRTGNIGKALLEGYGLKGGAIALTISHDSHNIVVLGDDNGDMAAAVAELERIGGGMAVIDKKKAYSYPLDIAGLMSSASAEEFVGASEALLERAYAMGVSRDYEAFMSLSFLGLAVIPELKLTDRGLFDVTKFSFIDIDAE